MNHEDPPARPPAADPVEALLHRQAPAPLPPALMARLREAAPPAEPAPAVRYFPWRPAAAAAALAIGGLALGTWYEGRPASVTASNPDPSPPTTAPAASGEAAHFFPSLESRQQLLSVRDLGVVHDDMDRAVRLMSATWLDENTYGDPGEKPALRESRFRHEIVPVLLPTY